MKKKVFTLAAALMGICVGLGGCGQKAEALSETEKWINSAAAILTKANQGDIKAFGGEVKNEDSKKMMIEMLKESWDVTDRKSADETMDWVLKEGHRKDYKAEMAQIKEMGLLEASEEEIKAACAKNNIENTNLLINMVEAYKKFGEHGIDAWDYCRAIQLLGFYYIADYYTKEEALDKSLEVAKELQKTYPSWEVMMESYMYGYQYWQEDDASDKDSATAARLAVYENLKKSKDNPYLIDWNIELKKSW